MQLLTENVPGNSTYVFRRGYLQRCSMSMSFANYRQEKANVWFRLLVTLVFVSGFLALATLVPFRERSPGSLFYPNQMHPGDPKS